jgi:HPt (histidine-containing phosphotransfer) domain-containing protein
MEDFLKNTRAQLTIMKISFENDDFQSIQKESHGIKGGAANLCAMPLSDAAKALENACRTNAQPAEIAKLFDIFMIALSQFDTFVNNQLEKL